MLKNPYINALLAGGYIVSIVLIINRLSQTRLGNDNIVTPMIALSLLVLSVLIMGILFVYQPLRLFVENQKTESLTFLTRAAFTFAGFVAVLFGLLLYFNYIK